VGSDDKRLYAINPTGTLKWRYITEGVVRSTPAVGPGGTIYVGSGWQDDSLYALNPNGSLLWEFATGYWVYSSPAIGADGVILVGSNDGSVYAINPNGSEKWSFATGGQIMSSPAIGADGTVYIGSGDNKLYAITEGDSGGGPCFIATAAYGTPMSEEIEILREFRNEYLLTSPVGRAFVGLYYLVSPPIAEFITEHPGLRPMVRAGLFPAVAMSTIAVNTNRAEKMVIVGLLVLVSVVVSVWATRRRGKGAECA